MYVECIWVTAFMKCCFEEITCISVCVCESNSCDLYMDKEEGDEKT